MVLKARFCGFLRRHAVPIGGAFVEKLSRGTAYSGPRAGGNELQL